ncbi:MAG: AAA family ATPase, partial [Paludibacteraceae bacterium]|nr:AAA family ATPase [Paludibacteraceae bacterium]
MNLINKTIEKLEAVFQELIKECIIDNYVITVQLYIALQIKLLAENDDEKIILLIFEKDSSLLEYREMIDIAILEKKDCDEDDLRLIFETDNKNFNHKNFKIRRSYNDLIDLPETVETPCPVVTFYSYKGGVGRTTLLYCMALYLANRGKQVVVIDCDFEAPGFTNYFGYRFGSETQIKNGLVEYVLDRQFLAPKGENYIQETLISQIPSSYSYKVGSEYTRGDIRLIKSGNYETNNIISYLESLARFDVSNVENFKQFLCDLEKAFGLTQDNSVILIDSRTGFTDTFSTLYVLSQLVIGVFGTNAQNITGLEFLVDSFLKNKKKGIEKEILFIKSFAGNDNNPDALYDNIKDYIKKEYNVETEANFLLSDNPHQSRFFNFKKHDELAKIGEESTTKEVEIKIAKETIIDDIYILNRKLFDKT